MLISTIAELPCIAGHHRLEKMVLTLFQTRLLAGKDLDIVRVLVTSWVGSLMDSPLIVHAKYMCRKGKGRDMG